MLISKNWKKKCESHKEVYGIIVFTDYFHLKHAINKQQQKQHTHLSIKHVHKSDVILMVQGIAGLSAVMEYLSKQ